MALNSASGRSGEELLRSALNKAELETLETLKLQYFQNATKYLTKGDYDNALAEIKRVLLIDPEHRLAREYEVRVTELQAARAQGPKAEPAPLKETSHNAPAHAPSIAPVITASPRPGHVSQKTWLYVAIVGAVLLGTAGIVTYQKDNEEEAPPVVAMAHPAQTAVTQQASDPVEQPAPSVATEQTPPAATPVVETKRVAAVAEKGEPKSEPVRHESPAASSVVSQASSTPSSKATTRQTPTTEAARPSTPVEKKVEVPVKKETLLAAADMKAVAASSPAVLTPAMPSTVDPAKESAPFVAVEKEPKLLHMEKVQLSDLAMRSYSGTEVKAKVLVDRDGKPAKVEIISCTNSLFEQPVIDALKKSTYSAGVMGTDAVSAWLVVPLKFK